MSIPRPIVALVAGVTALALTGFAPPDGGGAEGPPDHARVPDHAEVPFADDAGTDVEPTGVIALVDTGINPYHEVFRDGSERAQQHPSTYLEGYPSDAQRLDLTLDAASYDEAVEADCERWQSLEEGQLYWIPGTKIVGAVAVLAPGEGHDPDACPGSLILDGNSHGTMTASRAAAADWYGACETCRIVAVQGLNDEAVVWTARNAGWIDAQSNSWGPFPLWEPTGVVEEQTGIAGSPEFARNVEWSAQQHPTFFATGNGIMAFAGVIGNPTWTQSELTPSVIGVGGHDSGRVNTWPDAPPHVVSDSCESWAAHHDSLDAAEEDVGGGTSAASPYAAGQSVRYVVEARAMLGDPRTGVRDGVVAEGTPPAGITDGPLADGVFTADEWRELLMKSATERPEAQPEDGPVCEAPGWHIYSATPLLWTDVPDAYPEYHLIGYGAVDDPALETALAVLRGEEPMPDRSETDAFFAADDTLRSAVHDVYTTP